MATENSQIDDTQYQVKFINAILHHITAGPLPENEQTTEDPFDVDLQIIVYKHQAQTHLEIGLSLEPNDEMVATRYGIHFCMVGFFEASHNMPNDRLAEYTKMYSLSLLWPYAREYVSDLLRRMALPISPLPIINPQTMTQRLMEEGKIEARILE